MTAMCPPPCPLIVCFGDSLTAGWQSPLPGVSPTPETPPGKFLQARLKGRATVVVSGVCGELTAEMVARFRREVLSLRPASSVILGGTNDLGWDVPPKEIFGNLLTMYEDARREGLQAVAVTVPSIRGFDDQIPRRRELNALIAGACADRGIPCVDLFAATAEAETQRLAEPYSNDGLHLTTAGYEVMATLLYEQVYRNL
jgi:acyl-CoA thioesterase-1